MDKINVHLMSCGDCWKRNILIINVWPDIRPHTTAYQTELEASMRHAKTHTHSRLPVHAQRTGRGKTSKARAEFRLSSSGGGGGGSGGARHLHQDVLHCLAIGGLPDERHPQLEGGAVLHHPHVHPEAVQPHDGRRIHLAGGQGRATAVPKGCRPQTVS